MARRRGQAAEGFFLGDGGEAVLRCGEYMGSVWGLCLWERNSLCRTLGVKPLRLRWTPSLRCSLTLPRNSFTLSHSLRCSLSHSLLVDIPPAHSSL